MCFGALSQYEKNACLLTELSIRNNHKQIETIQKTNWYARRVVIRIIEVNSSSYIIANNFFISSSSKSYALLSQTFGFLRMTFSRAEASMKWKSTCCLQVGSVFKWTSSVMNVVFSEIRNVKSNQIKSYFPISHVL